MSGRAPIGLLLALLAACSSSAPGGDDDDDDDGADARPPDAVPAPDAEIVDPSVPVDTEGEVPRAGGEIPISAADAKLDALGGVGALLRW